MSNLRDRYKGAQLAANKDFTNKVEKLTERPRDGRPGFHEIAEGKNVFRICPPHDPLDPSMEAKCTTWLEIMVSETTQDGKETGKQILKARPLFNSRVHGGVEKDLVDEYIRFVTKQISDECQDKDTRQKKLAPITGWRSKDGKWNSGIRYSTNYVLYAFKDGKLGRLEIGKTIKDRMEELNVSDDEDGAITTDCFSDPTEGLSLIITRQKDKDGKWENVVSKREFDKNASKKYGTWDKFIESEMITDEQLAELDKQPSLKSIYRNSFVRSDFDKQLEGLRNFDEKNGFNLFNNDDFLKIVEELGDLFVEESEESQEQEIKESFDKSKKKPEVKSGDQFDKMDREALKRYKKEKGFPFIIKADMTDDMIRDLIREYESEVEETEEEEEVEEQSSEPTKEEVVAKSKKDEYNPKDLPWEKKDGEQPATGTVINSKVKDRLAQIREKAKKGTN